MAAISDYLEEAWLNTLRGTDYTAPTDVYLALFTTAPTDAVAGTEVSGGAYARQAVTFGAPTQESGSVGTIKNSVEVVFPAATASWGSIGWVALFDAATNGNMLWHGAVTTAKTVDIDDQVRFQVDELIITLE
jgi:hypothetical protein